MKESRNLYRLLHLQPDAPAALVRANYVALMTKLERHPDLGGDHWNAAILGAAYSTLKNSAKRAAYDEELLERYDLKRLANGPLQTKPSPESVAQTGLDPDGNQRNYYRVLGVQIDAPAPVITAAHRALRSASTSEQESILLDAAYQVVGHPEWRSRYDEILRSEQHAEAAKRATPPESEEEQMASQNSSALVMPPDGDYQPRIRNYCAFCMTPHGQESAMQTMLRGTGETPRCLECASPLFSPPEDLRALGRRKVARIQSGERVRVHVNWPEPRVAGVAIDISPTGLRCRTNWPIETGERIRIEHAVLDAVGEVTFHQRSGSAKTAETDAGIRFIAVAFNRTKGGFFQTTG